MYNQSCGCHGQQARPCGCAGTNQGCGCSMNNMPQMGGCSCMNGCLDLNQLLHTKKVCVTNQELHQFHNQLFVQLNVVVLIIACITQFIILSMNKHLSMHHLINLFNFF